MSVSRFSSLAACVSLLAACTTVPGPVDFHDNTPRAQAPVQQMRASFACSGALPPVHQHVCSSDSLAIQDRELMAQYRSMLQRLDWPGRLVLESSHRQWQLSRAAQCGLDTAAVTTVTADAQAVACLESVYRQRARALSAWPPAQPRHVASAHALASYAQFRLAEDRSPALCRVLGEELNRDLQAHGRPAARRLTGVTALAGSSAEQASTRVNGQLVSVDLYDAGPFAGYQTRARGLSIEGTPVMDDRTLPRWVAEQPNYGGRAHASSSQTGDYGSIDVVERGGQTLVLVNETWGFYSPAARGESAFAGVYGLNGQALQPLCLYQTYLTPPRTNTLEGLPSYGALQNELDDIAGDPLAGYAQHERRDNFQAWKEHQWTLLNLPLLGVDGVSRFGREGALRQRNDQALDALFEWSERNPTNKARYRQVMPMLQPAHQELMTLYKQQGLSDGEARVAADLLFLESLARAMENLKLPEQEVGFPLPAFANYQPRFDVAPAPGALERGRQFATLYSVLLNNAPLNVVKDFIDYETQTLGQNRRGLGPDESPALMAATANPEAVRMLLSAGFDVNQTNLWGKTALMSAAQLNRGESAAALLARGADVHLQTRAVPGAGVGGPDRKEAAQGRRTALLMAAGNADAALTRALLDGDAARQAWAGYHQEVCLQLEQNPKLDDNQRATLKAPLCAATYEPAPITRQAQANLRAGETLTIRDEGALYEVTLVQRAPMNLFGRPVALSPKAFRDDIRRIATNVGSTAVRRANTKLTGPLTLVFNDLAQNTEELLKLDVSFPVSTGASPVAGYSATTKAAQQVLSAVFDSQRNDVEGTWRALYSAAFTQGFNPTGEGYVVIHTRGTPSTEYQLVVTD